MKFTVKPDLLDLFRLVGAKGEEFSEAELKNFLKEYIKLRRLYDPHDPIIIDVQNDPLGKVFNSRRFSVLRAQYLLFTCLRPARNANEPAEEKVDSGAGGDRKDENKNKRKDHDFDSDALRPKRFPCLPPASPIYIDVVSGPEYDSNPETILSVQELYQLVSEPEETDLEFWADSSNCEDVTSEDWDPDITDCDKWLCKHCGCRNWPTMRFCQKCWQLRLNWLPDQRRRPPKRLRRKRKRQEGTSLCKKLSDCISELPRPGTSSAGISVVVEEHLTSTVIKNEDESTNTSENKNDSSLNFMDSSEKCDDEEMGVNTNSSQTSTDSNHCIFCLQRPRNACFVHGSSAHMLSCFHCARKLWQQGKPCPACRRNIQKIIRVYMY